MRTVVNGLGPAIVGTIFLGTGVLKALSPGPFAAHVGGLRLLPRWLLNPAVGLFIALEWGLGTALLVAAWPDVIVPATILLLVALSALTAWARFSGRATSCGCYAGLLELKPWQSLALNAAYVTLLGTAWWFAVEASTEAWQAFAVLGAFVGGGLTTLGCYLYARKLGRPLLDFSPLRVGRPWRPGTAALPEAFPRATLVVFLNRHCAICKQLLPAFNGIHDRHDLADVLGVLSDEAPPEEYAHEHGLRFPVLGVAPAELGRLVHGFPTALLIVDGVIREKWVGRLPRGFVERLRQQPSETPVGA